MMYLNKKRSKNQMIWAVAKWSKIHIPLMVSTIVHTEKNHIFTEGTQASSSTMTLHKYLILSPPWWMILPYIALYERCCHRYERCRQEARSYNKVDGRWIIHFFSIELPACIGHWRQIWVAVPVSQMYSCPISIHIRVMLWYVAAKTLASVRYFSKTVFAIYF